MKDTKSNCFSVIPAQAGNHTQFGISLANVMDSRLRGNDKMKKGQSPVNIMRSVLDRSYKIEFVDVDKASGAGGDPSIFGDINGPILIKRATLQNNVSHYKSHAVMHETVNK